MTVQHQRLACRKFITNTAALAHELWEGRPLPQYDKLRDRPIRNTGYVADTYASAWHSVLSTNSFKDAISDAINRGGDADTVGAVTGMIAGRCSGYQALRVINFKALQVIGCDIFKSSEA